MENNSNSGFTACSVVGIVCSGIGFIICWWLGIIGLVLSLIGLGGNKGVATVGILISIVELIVTAVVFSALMAG